MKSLFFILIATFFASYGISQNVSISNEVTDPHESAILDVFSTGKGFLLPRMTTAQRDAISDPAESLLIFNTVTKCFETYVLDEWHELWCPGEESEPEEPFECEDLVTDIDGNEYQTVEIGEQCWFAENLKTTRYNDGTDIPNLTEGTDWGNTSTGAYCWYENDYATYGSVYGALYNWFAASSDILCPEGWSVASDDDWQQMEIYLGMDPAEANTNGWRGTNQGAQIKDQSMNGTNTSGFSALAGGWRIPAYFSSAETTGAYFWTSTPINATEANMRLLHIPQFAFNDPDKICRNVSGDVNKINGMSVRCIKD